MSDEDIIMLRLKILVLTCLFWGCAPADNNSQSTHFPFDLSQPSTTFSLPTSLNEISGIALVNNGYIACIQDEKGIIFLYDTSNQKIISEILFGKKNDYEDIAIVGQDAFILESDGDLFQVTNFLGPEPEGIKYETDLSVDNDTEGLFYDEALDALLIACKGQPGTKNHKSGKNFKTIYRFDLKSKLLQPAPYLSVNISDIAELAHKNALTRFSHEIGKLIPDHADNQFKPSGLAKDPISNHLFVMAHVGNKLAIFNTNQQLIEVHELNPSVFGQPEGIFFDNSGNLYISNEKNTGPANILKFERKTN